MDTAMRNSRSSAFRPHVHAAAVLALLAAASLHAAQVVDPIHVAGGNRTAGDNLSSGTITMPAGTTMTFDVRYSVTSPQTANEAGLGLKLRYDANRFDNVNVTPVSASAGNFTDVISMLTKCAVAAPSDQVGTYSIGGFTSPREVIFGWLDTSIRAGGAVGWPGTADPAAPNNCLNPGFTTASGATAPPTTLFRVTMKTRTGFTSGSTTVRLTADGNVSFANASPGMSDKDIVVAGASAPSIALAASDTYQSRKTHGAAGTFNITLDPAGSTTSGSAVTIEPRQAVSGSHTIVINFTAPVSAAEFPSVTATVGAGPTTLPTSVTFSGSSMIVTVGNSTTPVPNASRIRVHANGVGAAAGVNPSVVVGFLLGDVSGNRVVNSTDVSNVSGQSGVPVTASNFRSDVTLNGAINSADVTTVSGRSGTNLP